MREGDVAKCKNCGLRIHVILGWRSLFWIHTSTALRTCPPITNAEPEGV